MTKIHCTYVRNFQKIYKKRCKKIVGNKLITKEIFEERAVVMLS